jgi:hypothetical protein
VSVIPKVQALIARAAHPETPVEEARTSAVIACKLIAEHELVIQVKNGAPPQGRLWPEPPVPGAPQTSFQEWLEEILFGYRARWRPQPPPAPRPKAKRSRGPKTRRKKPDPEHFKKQVDEDFRAQRCPHGLLKTFCPECGGVPPTRTVYTGACPATARDITCSCCRQPIRPGERMCWTDTDRIVPTLTPLTHERCVTHWQRDYCNTCGRKTT